MLLFYAFTSAIAFTQERTNGVTGFSIATDMAITNIFDAQLLALISSVDARPLYLDDALVALKLQDGSWRLIHACRSPRDNSEVHRRWAEYTVMDSRIVSCRSFKERPTPIEVAEFIHDSCFLLKPRRGYRILKGEIFYETWKRILGYTPTYKIQDVN
jgi:hypothetical protein